MRNFRLDDESGHQEALFEWAAYHMDCMPELEYMHHIPNGGIYLSPYEVKAAEENTHQKLEGIEELADSFLHVGQEQPTVLARVNGEYRIIDGHRRNEANKLNLERGHKEYEKVLFRSKDMSEAMFLFLLILHQR